MDFFPKQYKHESRTRRQRRNFLLQTAFKLFITNGLNNTSMLNIAQEAGVERRTLYNYYPHRDLLAMDILVVLVGDFHQSLSTDIANAEGSVAELRSYLNHFIDTLLCRPEIVDYFSQFDLSFRDYDNSEYEQLMVELSYSDPLIQLISKGVENGYLTVPSTDIATVAKTISNAIMGLAQRILIRPQVYQREQNYQAESIRLMVDIVIGGIITRA
ncbi:TetR/AcrR family transcriptional regulator [Gynuella sunshinyii]|uniref:Transcriptional regulator n=1 Tax=Gynuella sunshinyii YC6258 TaxID=1445510 RepID=A0A0C5VCZ1_9GAMM|nr:TetR/AcrR family transcriptional regulator [Gynuella sunshinyii]AJQ92377.1 transcriptional regulator [Gynuella sunshinyii YC6258]